MKYFIYILRCSDNSLYTGITADLERRISEHNDKEKKLGAKYTKMRQPVNLVYSIKCKDRSTASKKELSIKKMTKNNKELFIKTKN